jgi:hypothetical protein
MDFFVKNPISLYMIIHGPTDFFLIGMRGNAEKGRILNVVDAFFSEFTAM